MAEFQEGEIIDGIVTSIKKYGAFLSFDNGYIGLLHISEISTRFISNIFNYFKIGDTIKVVVKMVDVDSKYLNVSIKSLPKSMNPFKDFEESKKLTGYVKDIDFSKLDKALPSMIDAELKRERDK